MEQNKIKGLAKSLILDNGIELTYCERGEQNKEVIIAGAFYFHTIMPVLEWLAQHYHVYGVVMRMDGKVTEKNADGSTHWGCQWGKDVYDFAQKMGIRQFNYLGKCHGTVPGWWLVRNHPEVLMSFSAFFLAPHLKAQVSNRWFDMLEANDMKGMMACAMRNTESGLKKKMEEMASLGDNVTNPETGAYLASPEKVFDSLEECEHTMRTTEVPICYLFGTEDPLFIDHLTSNQYAMLITRGSRALILGGERHLMELDCPERIGLEAHHFITESKKTY